ncbi:MAG: KilA-N domain-containing protein [Candidatus Competibacter denitrificans]|jgi:hypothetical protein
MPKSLIVKTFEHEGQAINVSFTQDAFFNATKVAQAFGKRPADWLVLESTKEYIEAITRKLVLEKNQVVMVVNGGSSPGTWLHPKLGIVFARWLNVDFALWCDEIIDGILKGASSTATQPHPPIDAFKATPAIARSLKALGLDKLLGPNAFALSVDITVRKLYGASPLELSENTHLLADGLGKVYTPTELGKLLTTPVSGHKFNLLLESAGLQKRELGAWLPTDEAQGQFEWSDTNKRHSDGTPIKQLRWFKSVLGLLFPQQKEAA